MPDNEKISFEDGLEKLRQIVTGLESGSLNLDDTVKSYEEGRKLVKELKDILEDSRHRLSVLEDDGSLTDITDSINAKGKV